jgi:hypothetical protein
MSGFFDALNYDSKVADSRLTCFYDVIDTINFYSVNSDT